MDVSVCLYIHAYAPSFPFEQQRPQMTATITTTNIAMKIEITTGASTMPAITSVDNPAKVRIIYETLNIQTLTCRCYIRFRSHQMCKVSAYSKYTLVQ